VKLAHRNGWDVAIHAIGDLAVTNALGAISEGRKAHPGDRRDSIEHVQLFRPADLQLFKALGAVASIQPVFVPTDWLPAIRRWGEGRCVNAYAWKTLAAAGIAVQLGSDAPVEPIDPILGLHAAVTRETPQGNPPGGWCPSEKLTLEEGLSGFTRTAAWTARREATLGKIREGMWADLTIFAEDLFKMPPAAWLSVPVEMTVVDGEIVYRRE
jgi:predicted amidohydrolase YtcJ